MCRLHLYIEKHTPTIKEKEVVNSSQAWYIGRTEEKKRKGK